MDPYAQTLKSTNVLCDSPDEFYMSFPDELAVLISLKSNPIFNLNARNYEWVVIKAFEVLRENVDQDYLQCEFAVDVAVTIMPHIKLFSNQTEYDIISSTLLELMKKLHHRLVSERLFYKDYFPYIPTKFISEYDIIFTRIENPKPFRFKNQI